MAGKALWPALIALGGCAHYTPVQPEPREAGGVRGEILAIDGPLLAEFVVRLTPATAVPVGHFRLASSTAPPCAAGDDMKVELAHFPESLTLSSEMTVTLETSVEAASARLASRDAVVDIQVGDAAASCLRLPVSGNASDAGWIDSRKWGLGFNGGFAVNYPLSTGDIPFPVVAGLSLQRRVGWSRLGARADYGYRYAHGAGGVGPAAGARIPFTERWALAAELAYEFGGASQIGFVHGPRASLALMVKRPRPPGFEPAPLVGPGVELFGGYWFVPGRPIVGMQWYAGAGLVVMLGP